MKIISVDDQISEKNVAIIIKGGKLTGQVLAKAIKLFLEQAKKIQQKMNEPKHGKQSVKQLTGQGAGVSNIEITDKNIKSFESVARKYGVDFALRKDVSEVPPKWLVFFKSRDADALTAAFKEFSAKQLNKTAEKPSIIKSLGDLMAKVKSQVIDKTKHKEKGREL
ncbi:MAG: PcfB family protein [Oscillospiraceae bacterium]|nr:PcfB family protein [Oscillospiraceae bacterium]